MKDIKKHLKELKKKGLIFHTHDEVFGKLKNQSKEYQQAYHEEIARLNLVRQIRGLRIAKKLTQKAMAAKAQMPQSVIARIESGEHSFSLGTLSRIAHVFKKEIELV
ncbi:MAG: helix-turn-helix transcriptional regulator [bacterium]|nr:helix-turn-helix transcriptional regulator [bacterium]